MRKSLLPLALTLGLVVPAAAQTTTTTEWYVVQDPQTKRCTVVDKRPTTTTSVVVGDGVVYKTREEAERGMKTVKVCTSN